MKSEQHPHLRFRYDAHTYHGDAYDPYFAVVAPGRAQVYRLSREEFSLAELFDGERDARARAAAADELLGRPADAHGLRLLLHDLAESGLLEPGAEEPLPPPAQLASALDDRHNGPEAGPGFPSPTHTGSLAGPRHDADIGPRLRLPVALLLWLGHLFNVTLYLRLSFVPAGLTLAGLYGLWLNRDAVGADAATLLWLPMLALTVLASAMVVNLVSQLARAAAIKHYADERPAFGIGVAFGFFPRLDTATEGPVGRAGTRARTGIVAAPLHATLWLFVIAAIGWFTTRHAGGMLSSLWLGFGVISLSAFLIRLNPLARRDGYLLLAYALRAPNLRDQAWLSLFRAERPWRDRAPPRKGPLRLYGLAVAAYVILVVALIMLFPGHWLGNSWGGAGVVVFLVLIALIAWQQTRRMRAGRGRIESYRFGSPRFPRWIWLFAIFLALLALLARVQITYSPSGPVEILPAQRADVRATTAGVIRQVEAHEGEAVVSGDEILRLADTQQVAQLRAAEAELDKLQADRALLPPNARSSRVQAAQAGIEAQRARIAYARAELDKTRITAPIGGEVVSAKLKFARGDYLRAGDLVATVQNPSRLIADIRMPEALIDEVHLGAASSVKVWAYSTTVFTGKVTAIAPAAQPGEHGRVVRVRVTLDDPGSKLRPGMTGYAKIQSGAYPALVILARALARFVGVEVWSWLP